MKHINLKPVSAVVLALGTVAHAQQVATLAPVTVAAKPIVESNNLDNFSGFSTSVTASQIKDMGALDLTAALRMAPGVQISRYNEVGSYSGDQGGNVYIRGMGASRPGSEIKTYIDGIPVYMGLWNHPLMDLLPLNGMQSVEVHKGPQNQVSGNNLAAINLLTKRATKEGNEGEVNASVGSFATRTLQASLLGRKADLDYSLVLGQVESEGERPNADARLTQAMGRVAMRVNATWTVGLSFLSVDNKAGDPGDNRFPTSTSPVGPYSFANGVGKNASTTNLIAAFAAHQDGRGKGEIKVYQNRGHNNLSNDANWGTFDSNFNMSGLRWKEEFSPWKDGEFVGGIDHESVSGSIKGPHVGAAVGTPFAFGVAGSADIPAFKVTSAYAGLSHNVSLSGGWVLKPSAGARIYSSNHYASKAAPHAGVSLMSDNLTVYFSHAKGLLYPGAETYTLTRAIPMAFAASNGWDRLSPTEDKHTEAGIRWNASDKTDIDFSVFQDRISNRYVWSGFTPMAMGTWSNGFPDYRVNGTETSIKHAINREWSLFGGLTTLNPSLGNLPYAPKRAVSIGVTGMVGGYRIAWDAQHQSSMYSLIQDRGTFNPNQVPSFTVANARIARPLAALGKKGEVYVAINNLFDAQYQYNAGYPMPGRNIRVGLNASF